MYALRDALSGEATCAVKTRRYFRPAVNDEEPIVAPGMSKEVLDVVDLPVVTVPNSTTNQPTSAVWLPVRARVKRRFVADVRSSVTVPVPGLSSALYGVLPPL